MQCSDSVFNCDRGLSRSCWTVYVVSSKIYCIFTHKENQSYCILLTGNLNQSFYFYLSTGGTCHKMSWKKEVSKGF